jgi:NAD(P)-dependent dehydrogenase (short-subunit alcohol dehydrogenase family)
MVPLSSLQMEPEKRGLGSIFISSQLFSKPKLPPASTDLSGKVAIVTGGSTGLGLQCCHYLLKLKLSHLIIAVRSPRKGEDAKSQLLEEYTQAKIEVWELEMGSYESIQAFVKRTEQLDRLDAAILNAGLVKADFELNAQTGHEEVLQINYLSTMLLAILLLPALKTKSPAGLPGRLTIVGSGTAYGAAFPNRHEVPLLTSFDIKPEPYTFNLSAERYWCSKLLGHLFMVKLASYVQSEDVVVNIVDPGLCKGSQLNRDTPGLAGIAMSIMKRFFGRTLEAGASTYVDATFVKGEETHGSYVADWEIRP